MSADANRLAVEPQLTKPLQFQSQPDPRDEQKRDNAGADRRIITAAVGCGVTTILRYRGIYPSLN
jgi:hypothetical protein